MLEDEEDKKQKISIFSKYTTLADRFEEGYWAITLFLDLQLKIDPFLSHNCIINDNKLDYSLN